MFTGLLFLLVPLLILGGLVATVVAGLRVISGNYRSNLNRMPFDGAEAAKSAAIHVGLFLAMSACAGGLIDLLQALVEGNRIAGPNPDIARGLSLLIIGGPVFAGLLWVIEKRYSERSSLGDSRPHRGWSVYLVAALTFTLFATLISTVQVLRGVMTEHAEFQPNELMQLIGWLIMWLGHWFGLRPRFGVRGDAHLAIASIVGLWWTILGVGFVVFLLLDDTYQSLFRDSLASEHNLTFWMSFAAVGAVVWAWHWHLHLNAARSVEGDRRHSPGWFFTVVIAGILPGLVSILMTTTTMVAGVLVWFIGSTDEDAVDFFEPGSRLTTTLLFAIMMWAYHRWVLRRGGAPERNEALRFHDYSVLGIGLVGAVSAIAVIVSQLIRAIGDRQGLASDLDINNMLIGAITVLAASAAVWWWQWMQVEQYRETGASTEASSIWRKLYLTNAFGIGGLVLGISSIWVVFILLSKLLDSQVSQSTLQDLAGPVGWIVAVLGAIWYHLGVWRVDRAALKAAAALASEAETASPQVDYQSSMMRAATVADHGELFVLQRAATAEHAFRSGAQIIAAPQESFEIMSARLAGSVTVVAVDGSRIIGAICQPETGSAEQHILVAPDQAYYEIAPLLSRGLDGGLGNPVGRRGDGIPSTPEQQPEAEPAFGDDCR